MKGFIRRGLLLACVLIHGVAFSQGNSMSDEYAKQIKSAEAVGALGNDLFGEKVNFYTGSTEFTVTDVSLRGNNSLAVAVGRRFIVEPRWNVNSTYRPFGGWDFDIPHLQGVFRGAWDTRAGGGRRCNVTAYEATPPTATYQGATFDGVEYWSGTQLYVPGQGSQEMLLTVPENPHLPTDGKTYKWVTANQWAFSCLTYPSGSDAFLATAPDGTRYWFDWLVSRNYSHLTKGTTMPQGMTAAGSERSEAADTVQTISPGPTLPRQEAWLMPTRVEDRFGNWVTYTYNTTHTYPYTERWQLQQILASDGRQLSLTYNTNGLVATVSDGARTWTYGYGTDFTVTLPDSSQWKYTLGSLSNAYMETQEGSACDGLYTSGESYTGTITHPSGATGTFTFQGVVHGRSYVPRTCYQIESDIFTARYAKEFAQLAIKQKTISGPGIASAQWNYSYGPTNDSFSDECPTACPTTKTVEASGPGQWIRYTFGNKFRDTDGKLLKVETGTGTTNILRTETTSYLTNPTGQNYPSRIGDTPYSRSDRTAEKHTPLQQRQITQQGRVFTWQVATDCNGALCFDVFARPTKVTRSSAPVP